ncbi:helix-turn-helix domain-containing protein [Candidatus Curtissbacteria bacterium]|nr:helix-turn-helix domain-containing protein [Candidatus Curtissbacteria bacterium]
MGERDSLSPRRRASLEGLARYIRWSEPGDFEAVLLQSLRTLRETAPILQVVKSEVLSKDGTALVVETASGLLKFDHGKHEVKSPPRAEGRPAKVTDTEGDLLGLLMMNAGFVVTPEALHEIGLNIASAKVLVSHLRHKIGDEAYEDEQGRIHYTLIRTVWGQGYILEGKLI